MTHDKKTGRRLTDRQQRVLRAMSHSYELAYDIGQRAEVQARTVGPVLRGLETRGLVERKIVKERASMGSDHTYGWRLR